VSLRPEHPLLDQPVDQVPTAVLDFETTGLSAASGDRVCEIAVVRGVPGGKPKKRKLQTLVDPGMPMPELARSIHGIDDEQLRGAPSFAECLPRLARLLDGAVVVAHSAAFDVGFLRAECHRAELPVPAHGPVVCTLELARHIFGFSRCSLRALAQRMEIPQRDAHRALDDAKVTFKVYQRMLHSIGRDEMPTVRELLDRSDALRREGPGRARIIAAILEAEGSHQPVVIDYTSRNGTGPLTSRRTITVKETNLPYVSAWCHLRGADRVFHVRRIQRVIAEP
jgi:DNA polymerase-3 subunit epsilon